MGKDTMSKGDNMCSGVLLYISASDVSDIKQFIIFYFWCCNLECIKKMPKTHLFD